MDATLFESYEQDLETLRGSISTKLNEQVKELQGDQRRTLLRGVGRELEEADEIIAQMEIEAQTTSRDKAQLQAKLRDYKKVLSRLKADSASLTASTDRDDLLSTSTTPHTTIEMEDRSDSPSYAQMQAQRSKLLSATDKLTDGQRRLEDSHRVALETEDLGAGILRDLRGQRDQLEHTRDNLYEADGSIDRASGTLHKMVRRMYQQRAITYAIISILVFLIGYVLFSKLLG